LSAQSAKVIKAAHLLPPGFDPCLPGICELRDSVLWLSARSPAEAAKLRQALPGLQRLLLRNGFEINEIKVRLQPGLTAYQASASRADGTAEATYNDAARRAATRAPLEFAEKLSATLPESNLRTAVRSLAGTLRGVTRKR
jgi:hypothetical protein